MFGSAGFYGCSVADNPDDSSYHGIHDSIGNMSWSSFLSSSCARLTMRISSAETVSCQLGIGLPCPAPCL